MFFLERNHSDYYFILHIVHGQTARIIDGRTIAENIRSGIATEIRRMKDSIGKVPGLAVILVGQRRDSLTYVRNKIIACQEVGIKFVLKELPDNCSEDAICNALRSFNQNPSVHGILVQLPLPQVNSSLKVCPPPPSFLLSLTVGLLASRELSRLLIML